MSHSFDDVQAVLPTLCAEKHNSNRKVVKTANDLSLKISHLAGKIPSFGKIMKTCTYVYQF